MKLEVAAALKYVIIKKKMVKIASIIMNVRVSIVESNSPNAVERLLLFKLQSIRHASHKAI